MDVVVLSFQVAVISAVWTVLLLIASALLAAAAKHYDDDTDGNYLVFTQSTCDILDKFNADAQCGHVVAGTVRHLKRK